MTRRFFIFIFSTVPINLPLYIYISTLEKIILKEAPTEDAPIIQTNYKGFRSLFLFFNLSTIYITATNHSNFTSFPKTNTHKNSNPTSPTHIWLKLKFLLNHYARKTTRPIQSTWFLHKFLPNIKRLNALSFTTTYIFSGIEYNKS